MSDECQKFDHFGFREGLIAFNPKMSYPPPEWIKSDPDFWKPKTMAPMGMSMKKKAPEKPAAQ